MKKVAVIMGSVRTHRINHVITNWFVATSGLKDKFNVEIVDLKDWMLPPYDEIVAPMSLKGAYTTEHGKKWQKYIDGMEGFVFVTPEYNKSVPHALKTHVDYLFTEWNGKPTSIVSYGYSGGDSSSDHLQSILGRKSAIQVKMTETLPQLLLKKDIFNEKWEIADINSSFAQYLPATKKVVSELDALFKSSTK
ncbi:hypothetical protein SAMD00019534_091660 [Acytostelium subglobosum LB1]|uniref:hypothetical protein n=1 Tax=Acytostelium subglobosum LB1 TaxID=1410327 RepID=UPI000644F55F|nr:hypothetical protein SAMD00019534_091660 [Acytostelium subglobosum LB1]GAM25991.1 hypothetical protein SAMD00019534_091660 [Acytostelium subglobosum LB1]|eukprot:XP_012751034.1 hypothetical protein SAMD00019534_091660 [Acytostelium subglobosum LB1]